MENQSLSIIDIAALVVALIALVWTFIQYKFERLQAREEFIMNKIKSLYLFTKNSIKLLEELKDGEKNKSDFRDASYKDDLYADYLMRIKKTKKPFGILLSKKIKYINELEERAMKIREYILKERRKYPILAEEHKYKAEKLTQKNIDDFTTVLKKIREILNDMEEQEFKKDDSDKKSTS